jgi:23S rRNA (pseudouridine1915-N3)-methyltransferase
MVTLALKIIAVGKIKDISISQKCKDYIDKITYDARLNVIEIKDSDKATEGEKLISSIKKPNEYTIALTEFGKQYSSVELADHLGKINKTITFIIGGHHGLHEQVLKVSDECIALSRMTFTHEMARLILLEQVFRSVSILNNRSYHR